MSNNIVNQTPYLRTSRNFPVEIQQLVVEVNKSYIDIANAVNSRTISIFPTNRPAINGESWFLLNNQRQQAFRQVYTFTTTASIPHGIMVVDPAQFVRCFGTYTDGTNSYGLIYGTNQPIAGQLVFYVNPTNIVFVPGGGTMPPVTRGVVVLEWLSQP